MGCMKGWVGVKERELTDVCDPPLVVRVCAVLRLVCENVTSDTDLVP